MNVISRRYKLKKILLALLAALFVPHTLTCGQLRLNNIPLCHVHRDILDKHHVDKLMMEFILKMGSRCLIFGEMCNYILLLGSVFYPGTTGL